MKSTLLFPLLLLLATISITSCDKCDGENPKARIINNGTKEASVQIKTSGGNTENLNNVPVGQTSEYRSYNPGHIVFTVTVDKVDYVEEVHMDECHDYSIAIDRNNNISTSTIDRND
ncbi:hypothetical protein [Rufibacter roseus]|uniref:Uncharacterized protein n=1 Tax=Rufibacter roseus TaxID=1567108 RepID=A0ABW2DMM0_9BACT|nr:hypothetical protein [Rufibacter roseus]